MRLTLLAIFSGFFFSISAQQTNQTIQIASANRSFIQYLPSGFDPGTESLPLVFCLHGLGDNAQNMSGIGLNSMADTARFIVIYPQGMTNFLSQTSWNNGTALSSTANDVDFFDAMMNHMINTYNVNPARIYVSGFSMGAIMSYRLACSLNDRVAAIGVMSGALSQTDFNSCSLNYPTPLIHIHGTNDGTVPYDGSPQPSLMLGKESFDYWTAQLNCIILADSTQYPNIAADGLTADRFEKLSCDLPGSSVLIRVNGGGHTYFYQPVNDFTEMQEIWLFFRQWEHTNPAPASLNEIEASNLIIYPNPVSSSFKLDLKSSGEGRIFDSSGRLLKTVALVSGEQSVMVDELESGSYLLEIDGKRSSFIKL